jgi:ribosome-associated protein
MLTSRLVQLGVNRTRVSEAFKPNCLSISGQAVTLGFSNLSGENTIEAIELARHITDLIADKKGENITLLDIRERTVIADYFVICSGTSERQLKAIVESVTEEIKKQYGIRAYHVDGAAETGWVLVDYGNVIVHIFAPERRTFYDLESLWYEAAVLLKMQ